MRRVLRGLATQIYLYLHRPFLSRRIVAFSQNLREPERILIRLPPSPGELLFAIPTLERIRKSYRESRIFFLIPIARRFILRENPWCEGVILEDERIIPFSPAFFRWKNHLRKQAFDLYMDFMSYDGQRGQLLSLLSGAKVRMICGKGAPFFNCEIRVKEDHRNEVEKHLSLVTAFLPDSVKEEGIPLFLSEKRERGVRDFFKFQGVRENEKLIGVDFFRWDPSNLHPLLKEMENHLERRILILDSGRAFHSEGFGFGMSRARDLEAGIKEGWVKDLIHPSFHLKLDGPEIVRRCSLFLSQKTDYFSLAYALDVPTILFLRGSEMRSFQPPPKEFLKIILQDRNGGFPTGEVIRCAKDLIRMV